MYAFHPHGALLVVVPVIVGLIWITRNLQEENGEGFG
jgi:heme/copper-type cytochrome/quinol oxidase subunit 4